MEQKRKLYHEQAFSADNFGLLHRCPPDGFWIIWKRKWRSFKLFLVKCFRNGKMQIHLFCFPKVEFFLQETLRNTFTRSSFFKR
eukprot:UN15356